MFFDGLVYFRRLRGRGRGGHALRHAVRQREAMATGVRHTSEIDWLIC